MSRDEKIIDSSLEGITICHWMKKLNDAVARKSTENVKVIVAIVIEIIAQCDAQQLSFFISSLSEKTNQSKIIYSQMSGLFYLMMALQDVAFNSQNERMEEIAKNIVSLIKRCNTDHLIVLFINKLFEKMSSVGGRQCAYILDRLVKYAN